MENDLLAQYRRTPKPPASDLPTEPPEKEKYTAFATTGRTQRLRIHPANGPTHSLGYNLLLDVVYDRKKPTGFILVYDILLVMVEGKNFKDLIFALQEHRADYIQAFDSTCWDMPTDEKAPFIKSIEFQANDSASRSGGKHE